MTEQRHAHREKEEEVVVQVAEMMQAYRTTSHHKEALEIIGYLAGEGVPTPSSLSKVQLYLIIKLLLANGQRTGAIINAKDFEYKKVKQGDTDHHSFKDSDHKTKSTYGSANLVLDGILKRHLDIFVRAKAQYHKQAGIKSPFLFCGGTGSQLKSCNICTHSVDSRNF